MTSLTTALGPFGANKLVQVAIERNQIVGLVVIVLPLIVLASWLAYRAKKDEQNGAPW